MADGLHFLRAEGYWLLSRTYVPCIRKPGLPHDGLLKNILDINKITTAGVISFNENRITKFSEKILLLTQPTNTLHWVVLLTITVVPLDIKFQLQAT